MIINLSPLRTSTPLVLLIKGDVITANDVALDLSNLPDGATLPQAAVEGWPWLGGDPERIDGELHVTLRLPIGPHAPEQSRFPKPITVTKDGPVDLPPYTEEPTDAKD